MADKKKDINDDDLLVLLGDVRSKEKKIKLDFLNVMCGKPTLSMAEVRLIVDGVPHTEVASGNGPVDAAFTAVRKIVKTKVKLEEFLIQAITRGSDDVGKVHIQIEYKNEIFYGFGANTDIVTASVEAFIDAISNCLNLNRK